MVHSDCFIGLTTAFRMLTAGAPTVRTSRSPEQEPGLWSTRAERPWELSTGPAEEGRREGSLQVGGRVLSEDRPRLEGHAGLEVQGTALCSGRGGWEVNWEPEGWGGAERQDWRFWSAKRLSARPEVQGARESVSSQTKRGRRERPEAGLRLGWGGGEQVALGKGPALRPGLLGGHRPPHRTGPIFGMGEAALRAHSPPVLV